MTRLPSAAEDPTDEVRGSPTLDDDASGQCPRGVQREVRRAAGPGTVLVTFAGLGPAGVRCEHHERTVGRDRGVSFEGKRLPAPGPRPDLPRRGCHFLETGARVHRCPDGRMAVFHGPRRLAGHESDGSLVGDAGAAGDEGHARVGTARREFRIGEDPWIRGRVLRTGASLRAASLAHELPRTNNGSEETGQPSCYETGQTICS